MIKIKTGDTVRVSCKERTIIGSLMPRPELLGDNIVVVKLENGYNIGINKADIQKIELVASFKEAKKKPTKSKPKKDLPTVAVVSCGGTIASRVDYRTGGVYADYSADDFVAMCPELESIANIKANCLMQKMSEDLDYKDWQLMARAAVKALNSGADGVVFTHGTDTLHFSSAALSFFIDKLIKPVVLTGAQRSIDRGSSDAFMNLNCAITAAAKSDIAEVMTCMHGTTNDDYCLLIHGANVRKMHTSRRDAFRPINSLPLARVYYNRKIETISRDYNKRGAGECLVDDKFEAKTALVYVHPGMDPEIVDYYLDKGYKGMVIAATALGHVPTNTNLSLIPKLKRAADEKIPIIISSQTLYGKVHPLVYTNLRKLSLELGCIFSENIHPETAFIKLGWLLAKTNDTNEIKKLMQTNLRGEINTREDPKTFLY